MLCHGIDLSFLRWRYNGNINIVTFFSDTEAPSSVNTNNPAFLSVELLSVAQDPVNRNFAKFSSKLVVDLSKLQTESVTSITCGDPNTFKMVLVDVEIIQETEPESPNGTNVTALYEGSILTDVIVSWERLVSYYNINNINDKNISHDACNMNFWCRKHVVQNFSLL